MIVDVYVRRHSRQSSPLLLRVSWKWCPDASQLKYSHAHPASSSQCEGHLQVGTVGTFRTPPTKLLIPYGSPWEPYWRLITLNYPAVTGYDESPAKSSAAETSRGYRSYRGLLINAHVLTYLYLLNYSRPHLNQPERSLFQVRQHLLFNKVAKRPSTQISGIHPKP